MALTLNTYIDEQKLYSCDFPDLQIATSYGFVNFTLEVNGTIALSTRYYAVSGIVKVRNLVPVIELTMRRLYRSFCTVDVSISAGNETATASCQVLLCTERCMSIDVSAFISNSFLTTNLNRLTTLHGEETLSFYIPGSGNYAVGTLKYYCVVRKADGSIGQYEWTSGRRFSYGISSVGISAKDVQNTCRLHFGVDCQLLSFVLTYGPRVCHFYVAHCPSAEMFRFTNIFGCSESVALPAPSVAKIETDFSEALLDGKLTHYDVKHTRTYEMQTASLLASYMSWLEQFLTSHSIMRYTNGMYRDVLIKEYTFEQTNAPGEANTIQFTWQFTDNRLTTHQFTYNTGVFADQFTEEFA